VALFFLERFEPDSYSVLEGRVEMAWWLLEKYADDLEGEKYVIERYPNNGMIVEVTPI
jgi:pyruvate formate-lyase activating enzyme-like uncharacterized protein